MGSAGKENHEKLQSGERYGKQKVNAVVGVGGLRLHLEIDLDKLAVVEVHDIVGL